MPLDARLLPLPRTSSVFLQGSGGLQPAGAIAEAQRLQWPVERQLWANSFKSLVWPHLLPSSFNHGFRQKTCFPYKSQSLGRPSQVPLRIACLLMVRLIHSWYHSGELATVRDPWLDFCCVRLQLCSCTHHPPPALGRHMDSKPGVHICWGRGLLWY